MWSSSARNCSPRPAGTPYGVFTPYTNSWIRALTAAQALGEASSPLRAHAVAPWAGALAPLPAQAPGLKLGVPGLSELGFQPTNLHTLRMPAGCVGGQELLADFLDERIDRYHDTRNFPAIKGPSYLSTHLRFGTVSIRQLAREAWSRLQAGSSATGRRGFAASARPIATRCCWPPDSCSG